jgi:hypothetical protein
MRELDGRPIEIDGLGRLYVCAEWDSDRKRVFLVLRDGLEDVCRCRLEFDQVADAMRHPLVYLAEFLP